MVLFYTVFFNNTCYFKETEIILSSMDTLLLTGNNTLMALLRRLLAASNFHAAVKIRRTHEILINKSL